MTYVCCCGCCLPPHSPQRWSLHHELQLFERVLRRTPAPTATVGQQQALSQALQQAHPFAPHLGWSMVPLAAMIRCLHGLATADMQVRAAAAAAAAAVCRRTLTAGFCQQRQC